MRAVVPMKPRRSLRARNAMEPKSNVRFPHAADVPQKREPMDNDRIGRIRAQIADGVYISPHKITVTVDRVLADLTSDDSADQVRMHEAANRYERPFDMETDQ